MTGRQNVLTYSGNKRGKKERYFACIILYRATIKTSVHSKPCCMTGVRAEWVNYGRWTEDLAKLVTERNPETHEILMKE